MDNITKYLNNISYKFPKGYPDVNDPKSLELIISTIEFIFR